MNTINHISYNDYLTGLPNSNGLNERLKELVYNENETAILLLELERMNNIRDSMGQEATNSIILLASERIKLVLGTDSILTRWQEDKFVILLTNTNHEQTIQTAKNVLETMAQPLKNIYHDVYVNPSIGVSIYSKDSNTLEALLDMANSALHYAKKHGNKSYHFYTPDLKEKTREGLELEMELYRAIELDQLTLHYQPQFHLSTGEYIGNEALIRWNHPKRGMVSPAQFIPIAEETGLIIPIGEWVMKTACAQNKEWQLAGFPPMVISVNLSARQFSQTNIVEVVERILTETKLEAKYLDLEITESMTMEVESTIIKLQALKKLGIKISIDDFGTGYSSLYYLKEFPIDRLKIDQSFIRDCHIDPSNATIVKTIISMAHHLSIQVIAEGVETKEHLNFLQQNLCDEVQGYLLSKPVPAKTLEEKFPDFQKIIRSHGVTSEVSHHFWLEREMKITTQELQETLRQQDGMIFKFKYKDGKFIHTFCDGELLYRIGLTPELVIGKELSQIFSSEKAIFTELNYKMAWEGEKVVSYEGENNGVYYLVTLRPISRLGKIVEVIASCMDITERKTEEFALLRNETIYRLIAENISDTIHIVDKDGLVLYSSPASEVLKGYPSDQIIGLSLFSFIYPNDSSLVKNVFQEIIATKTPNFMKYRYILKNKTLIHLEAKIIPVIEENGDVERLVLVTRDITQQIKAINRLKKLKTLSAIRDLAAKLAHKISSPATSKDPFNPSKEV